MNPEIVQWLAAGFGALAMFILVGIRRSQHELRGEVNKISLRLVYLYAKLNIELPKGGES